MSIRRHLILLVLLGAAGTAVCGAGSGLAAQEAAFEDGSRLFQYDPESSADLIRAALVAVRLERGFIARSYLQRVLDRDLSSDELLEVRENVGIETFLQLNARRDAQPQAGQLLKQVNAASAALHLTADQVPQAIERLSGGTAAARKASAELLRAGDAAVPAILQSDARTRSGKQARRLMAAHPRLFRHGLVAALPTASTEDRVLAMKIMAVSGDAHLAAYLLEWQFAGEEEQVRQAAAEAVRRLWPGKDRPQTAAQAVSWLVQQVRQLLKQHGDPFYSGSDQTGKKAVALSRGAVRIAPNDAAARAVNVAALAATGGLSDGPDEAVGQAALEIALEARNGAAVLRLLKDQAACLTRAVAMPDPAVRLRAAIGLLQKDHPVRGQGLARTIVADMASGSVEPEAVVIDARGAVSTVMAGLVQDQGYDVVRCRTGQQGFDAAVGLLQCELVFVHSNCVRWGLSSTVANLRADARTARTPIVVYGPEHDRLTMERLQQTWPGIYVITEPLSEINFASELTRAQVPGPRLSRSVRERLIGQAREKQSQL